jgi:hypothetical protein
MEECYTLPDRRVGEANHAPGGSRTVPPRDAAARCRRAMPPRDPAA